MNEISLYTIFLSFDVVNDLKNFLVFPKFLEC